MYSTFPEGMQQTLRRQKIAKVQNRPGACASSLCFSFCQSACVEERHAQQQQAQYGERGDLVAPVERGKVKKEDLRYDQSKQQQGLPAQQHRFLLDAEKNQHSGVNRPQNRQRKVACEFGIRSDGCFAEEIPELQRESDKSKRVDSNGKDSKLDPLLAAGFVRIFLRGPQRYSEAGDHQQVASKSLIEKKRPGWRRKEEKAESGNRKKNVTELAQETAKRAKAGPDEDRALYGENERNPFAFEANGNGERGKRQAKSSENIARQQGFGFFRVGNNSRNCDVTRRKRQH